jgi:DUF1365 family protein
MNSCVYQGIVRHRRHQPLAHQFQYRMFMLYLDLAELPQVFDGRWLWSARRWAPAWFKRADYLGDPSRPLDAEVRDLVEARTGRRPTGPIRLLTHLRYWGYVQNPASFYYCFDEAGTRLETFVAEITNTPWAERHAYVVSANGAGGAYRSMFQKTFHVSPLMPMEQSYDWRFHTPGDRLFVHMENRMGDVRVFDATLTLERAPLSGPVLAGCLARHPWMTASIVSAIYWQALKLRLRGVPFHPHPATRRSHGTSVVTR